MKLQFLFLLSSRVLASLLSAISFVLIGRLAGVAPVGQIGLVLSIAGFVSLVADFGMSTFLSKSRAQGDEEAVAKGLRFNRLTTLAFIVVMTAGLAIAFSTQHLPGALILLGLFAALEKNTETSLAVAFADGSKFTPAFSIVLRRVLAIAAFLGLYFLGSDAVLAFCAGSLIAAIVGQLHIRNWLSSRTQKDKSPLRDVLSITRDAYPYFISNVTGGARSLDVAIVAALSTAFSAGIYAAAARIVAPFYLIPGTLTSLVVPHASRLDARQSIRAAKQIALAFAALQVLTIGAAFFSGPVVRLLLGEEFAAAGDVLAILLVGLPAVGLTSPLGSILQAQGHQRFVGVNGICFAVVTLVMIGGGVLVAGAAGGAVGLGLSYLVKCLSLAIAIRTKLRPATDEPA